ncbi:hypothetical protein IQ272_30490 [Chroococcidiopsidales cyanobacterium LEGE 13417]|nr:hypothetical protein [Chroococcidiopsidales cyanobacterium LEGE 13417]
MKPERQDSKGDRELSGLRTEGSNSSVTRATLYLIVLLLCGGFVIDYWSNHKQLPPQLSGSSASVTGDRR